MLKILTGASGHGKTYTLYNKIIQEAIKNPDKKYILIVPEQSSLQAQKDVVRMHPNHGIFNIDILTFGRLSYRIFEELGTPLAETIDDTGKNLIVRKALNDVGNELKIIKAGRRQGLVSEIKSMISELKQYGIHPKELDEIIEELKAGDRIKQKLVDISQIYKYFEEYIDGKYTTSEDRPEMLLKVMDDSAFLKNSVVAFDGFTGFTPVQYRIIEKILETALDVMVTATIPYTEKYNQIYGEEDLFFMSKNMIGKLGTIADKMQIRMEVSAIEPNRNLYRFTKSKELEFLEEELFRYSNKKYSGKTKDIIIGCFDNEKKELQYTAAAILKEVRQRNLRYRDIAIITGDMESYRDDAARIFTECNIPYFIDSKRSLIGNPLVEYIRSGIQMITEDFSYESVFRFLKNGLCDVEAESVDILENYVLAFGIRGNKKWNDMFIRKYPGKTMNLMRVNDIRKEFLTKIEILVNGLKENQNAGSYVRAIFDFMEQENLYDKMNELAEAADEQKAAEYDKTYKQVIDLLDRIYSLMGEEVISLTEFAEILDAGFEEIKVGIIPPSVDCITIGDVERTRLEHVKLMFVLGMNEGLIPKLSPNKGVLSETERKILADNNVELSPMPREKVFIQNFYLYLNMTEPEGGLYLFYHRFDNNGKDCKISRMLSMIKEMYPDITSINDYELPICEKITNAENSKHLLMECLSDNVNDKEFSQFLAYYLNDEHYIKEIENIINLYDKKGYTDTLTKETARRLYENIESSSISRIETFAACAYSHFAKYGLELDQRKIYELDSADLGSVFHMAIKQISEELKRSDRTFADLNDEERKMIVASAVEKVTLDFKDSFFTENSTNSYMKIRIMQMVERTIWALGKQLEAGIFKPYGFETGFTRKYHDTVITGKIDRIDKAEAEGKTFVKIIDYKSSKKKIDYDDIFAGINLQMLVYLDSVLQKDDISAGIIYNKIDDPIVSKDKNNDIDKSFLEKMKPEGLITVESLKYLDKDMENKTFLTPVTFDRSGNIKMQDGNVVTDEQLKCLSKFAVRKMDEMKQDIEDGIISVNPYEKSCEYCQYKSICGFSIKRGDRYRKKEKLDKTDDMWQKFGFGGNKNEMD